MTNPARNRSSKAPTKRQADKAARMGELTDQLAAGIQDLAATDAWQRYLDFQAKFPRYSFGNCMLILMQCPNASLVMPYGKEGKPGSTWVNIGRHARRGEHALYIRKPVFKKTEADDSLDGKEHTSMHFVWVPVFDISQTEGEPVPCDIVQLLDGDDPDGILARVVAFIEHNGYTVNFVPEIPGSEANGDCTYGRKTIRVCTNGRTPLQQAKTACHEAGHMLLHADSIAARGLKEMEAESVAYVVMQYVGLKTDGYSFGYVLGWMGQDADKAREAIKASGTRIQKAARAILEGIGALEAREYTPDLPEGVQGDDSEAVAA
jgi:hypothetical protein